MQREMSERAVLRDCRNISTKAKHSSSYQEAKVPLPITRATTPDALASFLWKASPPEALRNCSDLCQPNCPSSRALSMYLLSYFWPGCPFASFLRSWEPQKQGTSGCVLLSHICGLLLLNNWLKSTEPPWLCQ